VNLIEELRDLLDLVEHDLAGRAGSKLLPQELGTLEVRSKIVGLEQIDPEGVRVGGPQQGRLADLPWPP
jgi:hypothetical protein